MTLFLSKIRLPQVICSLQVLIKLKKRRLGLLHWDKDPME